MQGHCGALIERQGEAHKWTALSYQKWIFPATTPARIVESMDTFTPTAHTQVRRIPARGVYDRAQVYSILDEGYVCHVGFAVDGQPYVIPTGYARLADEIFIHGSAGRRMGRALGEGIEVCVTVTLVDGLVLARSAFHHSMNYRSVVIVGFARMVEDPVEKMMALRCFTNHVVPKRWEEV